MGRQISHDVSELYTFVSSAYSFRLLLHLLLLLFIFQRVHLFLLLLLDLLLLLREATQAKFATFSVILWVIIIEYC